jgi:hypothetical protein
MERACRLGESCAASVIQGIWRKVRAAYRPAEMVVETGERMEERGMWVRSRTAEPRPTQEGWTEGQTVGQWTEALMAAWHGTEE